VERSYDVQCLESGGQYSLEEGVYEVTFNLVAENCDHGKNGEFIPLVRARAMPAATATPQNGPHHCMYPSWKINIHE